MTAACMALLGLTFTCPGGIHMFTLFNESAPSWNLLLFALLEVILISWAYGADKFLDHLEDMIPHFSRIAKVISIWSIFSTRAIIGGRHYSNTIFWASRLLPHEN